VAYFVILFVINVNPREKHQPNNASQRQCKRVAAYHRVSKNTPAQLASLEQQLRAYEAMIVLNPDWELAGIAVACKARNS